MDIADLKEFNKFRCAKNPKFFDTGKAKLAGVFEDLAIRPRNKKMHKKRFWDIRYIDFGSLHSNGGCNIEDLDFSYIQNLRFYNSNIKHCVFQGASIDYINNSYVLGCTFHDTVFGKNCEEDIFMQTGVTSCYFSKNNMVSGARISNCTFTNTCFGNETLTGSGLNISASRFIECENTQKLLHNFKLCHVRPPTGGDLRLSQKLSVFLRRL